MDLGLVSAAVHVVYGTHDALIRVWATNSSRRKLVTGLKEASEKTNLSIAGVREFASSDVRYFFGDSPSSIDERTIQEHRDEIGIVATHDYYEYAGSPHRNSDDYSQYEPAKRRLIQDSLLVAIEDKPGVKFYVFMSDTDSRSLRRDLVQPLEKVIEDHDLVNGSLYSGAGFSDYIFKAIAPSYEALLPAVNAVRRVAKAHSLDPWSLPVADYGRAPFGETLDAVVTNLPGELDRFVGKLSRLGVDHGPELTETVYSLPSEQQGELDRILASASESLPLDQFDWFSEIVAYALLGDRKSLNKTLSFLTSLEEDLRTYLPLVMVSVHGDGWLKRLQEDGALDKNHGDQGWVAKAYAKWTLADLLRSLSFSRRYPTVADKLGSLDRIDWRQQIRSIEQTRDEFAHGAIFRVATSQSFGGDWGVRLRAIVAAMAVQKEIETQLDGLR